MEIKIETIQEIVNSPKRVKETTKINIPPEMKKLVDKYYDKSIKFTKDMGDLEIICRSGDLNLYNSSVYKISVRIKTKNKTLVKFLKQEFGWYDCNLKEIKNLFKKELDDLNKTCDPLIKFINKLKRKFSSHNEIEKIFSKIKRGK